MWGLNTLSEIAFEVWNPVYTHAVHVSVCLWWDNGTFVNRSGTWMWIVWKNDSSPATEANGRREEGEGAYGADMAKWRLKVREEGLEEANSVVTRAKTSPPHSVLVAILSSCILTPGQVYLCWPCPWLAPFEVLAFQTQNLTTVQLEVYLVQGEIHPNSYCWFGITFI